VVADRTPDPAKRSAIQLQSAAIEIWDTTRCDVA
jgi:hypothetical protein